MTCSIRPTPSFGRSPGPGGEGDSFGLHGVWGWDRDTILEKKSIGIQALRLDEAGNDQSEKIQFEPRTDLGVSLTERC